MATHAEDIQSVKAMAQTIAQSYSDPQDPHSRLGLAIGTFIQSIDPGKILLPDNPTEMQKRELLSTIFNTSKGLLATSALTAEVTNDIACSKLSKEALGRFDRYLDLAAENAKKTFKDDDGKAKFYAPEGVAQLSNLQLQNENSKGMPPAAIGCEIIPPHASPIKSKEIDTPGIAI